MHSFHVLTDPVLYRLFEMLLVYGYPLKDLIHEKFSDGIMSASEFRLCPPFRPCRCKQSNNHTVLYSVDFTGHVDRVEDPAGDRVKITLNGKFLPYKRW